MMMVLILGGFHLMMSFLGSIGDVMNGSGLVINNGSLNGDSSNDNEELELGESLLTNNEIDEIKTLCETVLDGPDDSVTLVN